MIIHSIHSIHENDKAPKTNTKQRENAMLPISDVSSLHRGIHRSTSYTIGRKRRENMCFNGLLADVDLFPFFWVLNPQDSAPITSGTHTDGGADL